MEININIENSLLYSFDTVLLQFLYIRFFNTATNLYEGSLEVRHTSG